MPQNLEVKAHYSSLRKGVAVARKIGAQDCGILKQEDIYFCVSHGRLKLRIINGTRAELIYYVRPDEKSGRYSTYSVLPLPEPKNAKKFFQQVYKTDIVVKKRRRLFLWKGVRIHLDTVHALGTFLEFEVPVKTSRQKAEALLQALTHHFSLTPDLLIAHSYSDLLRAKK